MARSIWLGLIGCLFIITRDTNCLRTRQQQEIEASDLNKKPYIDGDSTVNATRGKTVSLLCSVHHLNSYKIAWYFNGILLTLNNVRIKDDRRYTIENPTPHDWRLTIAPVDSENEGQYSCRLNNGLKRNVYLRVGIPPHFVGHNDSSHRIVVTAVEKQNVTMLCEAEGNPKPEISWYKAGKLISTSSQLVVRNVSRHTHPDYECVARNGVEPAASRHFFVSVYFKPSINLMYHLKSSSRSSVRHSDPPKKSEDHVLSEHNINSKDGDLQLLCEISGNPINSISWFKDGIRIKQESGSALRTRYHSQNTKLRAAGPENKMRKKIPLVQTSILGAHKFLSKLKLNDLDYSDNGIYKCAVDSLDGEHSKTVIINDIKDVDSEYYDQQQVFSVNQYKQSSGHVNRNSNMKQSRHESVENDPHAHGRESAAVAVSDHEDDDHDEAALESSSFMMHTARGARSNSTQQHVVGSLSNLFYDGTNNAYSLHSASSSNYSIAFFLISSMTLLFFLDRNI